MNTSLMPLDKIKHHAVGALIYAGLLILLGALLTTWPSSIWATLVLVSLPLPVVRAVAYSKECWDEARPAAHTRDWLDAEATAAGATYAWAVVVLLQLVARGVA